MSSTTLTPVSSIEGNIQVPPSKSVTQRVFAAALLAKGTTHVINSGNSSDEKAALEVIKHAGATVIEEGEVLKITSEGIARKDLSVNLGESGLGVRMFTPILALSEHKVSVNAKGSLLNRPMDFFDSVLKELGVEFKSNQGRLPFIMQGPLKPTNITVDGSVSSQFITGLLYAFAASAKQKVSIQVKDLTSRPYLMLTVDVLKHFGIEVQVEVDTFTINPNQIFKPCEIKIEGDWSGAAILMVVAAISGKIQFLNLNLNSAQADRKILAALEKFGAEIQLDADSIIVTKKLAQPFEFDATECPDLFPPLAVLAAFANGKSVIQGTKRLVHKESNRAIALQQELGKLGIIIELQDNKMIISGGTACNGGTTDSHNDHRIAMACAVAALRASSPVTINNSQAIKKSYPEFYGHLGQLGVQIEEA